MANMPYQINKYFESNIIIIFNKSIISNKPIDKPALKKAKISQI